MYSASSCFNNTVLFSCHDCGCVCWHCRTWMLESQQAVSTWRRPLSGAALMSACRCWLT